MSQLDALADELAGRLGPQLVDAIADEVARRLAARAEFLDAAEVAEILNVSRDTVYELADDLGAVRIGDGERPRLRFSRVAVDDALHRRLR